MLASGTATSTAGTPDPALHALTSTGRVLAKTSVIYALGSAAAIPVGLATLALTTRYLGPADYGKLAALFAFAGTLTMIIGMGSLQGTLMWAFGLTGDGDEDAAGEGDVVTSDWRNPVREGRRIMGSGLIITAGLGALTSVAVVAWAPTIDRVILHTSNPTAVRLAAVSAATGAVWRLVQQVYRLERRPVAFSVVSTFRPILVIALIVPVVTTDWGVVGVIAATAAGTAMACVVAIVAAHKNFRFAPRRGDIREIYSRGKRLIPLNVVTWSRSYLDVLLLTQLVAPRAVGFYHVATRITQLPLHLSSAFLMAWPPLERSPVFRAVVRTRGQAAFSGLLYTYLMVLTIVLAVALALMADLAVKLAQPSFAPAASLIPLTAGAALAHIAFYGLFRACRFRTRRFVYQSLALAGVFVYAGLGGLLVPQFGTYALPACAIVSSLIGASGMLLVDRRHPRPVLMSLSRLFIALGLAVGCVVAARYLTPEGWPRTVAEVSALPLLLLGLVATGVVPRTRLSALIDISKHSVPWRLHTRKMLARWSQLGSAERQVIWGTCVDRQRAEHLTLTTGVPLDLVRARLVRGIRTLADVGSPKPYDHAVGEYLLSTDPTVERDQTAFALAAHHGVPLVDLHELEVAFRALRRTSRRRWRRVAAGAASERGKLNAGSTPRLSPP